MWVPSMELGDDGAEAPRWSLEAATRFVDGKIADFTRTASRLRVMELCDTGGVKQRDAGVVQFVRKAGLWLIVPL